MQGGERLGVGVNVVLVNTERLQLQSLRTIPVKSVPTVAK